MPVPKSVVKIYKNGVKYTSSVDRVQYTISELSRAALRDIGKFICRNFEWEYYKHFKNKKGKGGYAQYWVRHNPKYQKNPYVQVGLKSFSFYGGFQEFGSSKTPRLGLLSKTVNENIAEIVKIESQYLSALEDEAKALALIDESEYEGGADG